MVDAMEESIAMLQKLAGDDICHHTEHLDITDIEAIRQIVKEQDIDVIVNCAAYTNVDKAEDNPELAELLNAKAVENLASPVKRPAYSVLDKTKIKETFGLKIPYWTDSLRKCINNLGVDV